MLLNDFLSAQKLNLQHALGSEWQEVMLGSITPNNFGAGARMIVALIECAGEIEKQTLSIS